MNRPCYNVQNILHDCIAYLHYLSYPPQSNKFKGIFKGIDIHTAGLQASFWWKEMVPGCALQEWHKAHQFASTIHHPTEVQHLCQEHRGPVAHYWQCLLLKSSRGWLSCRCGSREGVFLPCLWCFDDGLPVGVKSRYITLSEQITLCLSDRNKWKTSSSSQGKSETIISPLTLS